MKKVKWEYSGDKVTPSTQDSFMDKLNEAGEKGWELCGLLKDDKKNVGMIFKREKE